VADYSENLNVGIKATDVSAIQQMEKLSSVIQQVIGGVQTLQGFLGKTSQTIKNEVLPVVKKLEDSDVTIKPPKIDISVIKKALENDMAVLVNLLKNGMIEAFPKDIPSAQVEGLATSFSTKFASILRDKLGEKSGDAFKGLLGVIKSRLGNESGTVADLLLKGLNDPTIRAAVVQTIRGYFNNNDEMANDFVDMITNLVQDEEISVKIKPEVVGGDLQAKADIIKLAQDNFGDFMDQINENMSGKGGKGGLIGSTKALMDANVARQANIKAIAAAIFAEAGQNEDTAKQIQQALIKKKQEEINAAIEGSKERELLEEQLSELQEAQPGQKVPAKTRRRTPRDMLTEAMVNSGGTGWLSTASSLIEQGQLWMKLAPQWRNWMAIVTRMVGNLSQKFLDMADKAVIGKTALDQLTLAQSVGSLALKTAKGGINGLIDGVLEFTIGADAARTTAMDAAAAWAKSSTNLQSFTVATLKFYDELKPENIGKKNEEYLALGQAQKINKDTDIYTQAKGNIDRNFWNTLGDLPAKLAVGITQLGSLGKANPSENSSLFGTGLRLDFATQGEEARLKSLQMSQDAAEANVKAVKDYDDKLQKAGLSEEARVTQLKSFSDASIIYEARKMALARLKEEADKGGLNEQERYQGALMEFVDVQRAYNLEVKKQEMNLMKLKPGENFLKGLDDPAFSGIKDMLKKDLENLTGSAAMTAENFKNLTPEALEAMYDLKTSIIEEKKWHDAFLQGDVSDYANTQLSDAKKREADARDRLSLSLNKEVAPAFNKQAQVLSTMADKFRTTGGQYDASGKRLLKASSDFYQKAVNEAASKFGLTAEELTKAIPEIQKAIMEGLSEVMVNGKNVKLTEQSSGWMDSFLTALGGKKSNEQRLSSGGGAEKTKAQILLEIFKRNQQIIDQQKEQDILDQKREKTVATYTGTEMNSLKARSQGMEDYLQQKEVVAEFDRLEAKTKLSGTAGKLTEKEQKFYDDIISLKSTIMALDKTASEDANKVWKDKYDRQEKERTHLENMIKLERDYDFEKRKKEATGAIKTGFGLFRDERANIASAKMDQSSAFMTYAKTRAEEEQMRRDVESLNRRKAAGEQINETELQTKEEALPGLEEKTKTAEITYKKAIDGVKDAFKGLDDAQAKFLYTWGTGLAETTGTALEEAFDPTSHKSGMQKSQAFLKGMLKTVFGLATTALKDALPGLGEIIAPLINGIFNGIIKGIPGYAGLTMQNRRQTSMAMGGYMPYNSQMVTTDMRTGNQVYWDEIGNPEMMAVGNKKFWGEMGGNNRSSITYQVTQHIGGMIEGSGAAGLVYDGYRAGFRDRQSRTFTKAG